MTTRLECQSCGAALAIGGDVRTAICPYCASPSVVERPPTHDRPSPGFAIGFRTTKERARAAVRHWLRSQGFFRQSGLGDAAIEDVRGVYLPAYLYTALARTGYSAEIAEHYQEEEEYEETDSNGNTVKRTRTVTRTEWRSLEGQHASWVMDVLVTASRGVHNADLEWLEPYDLRELRRYEPALVSGWIAEEPSRAPSECFELARNEALQKIGRELAAFMPGDGHRGLRFDSVLENESADLVLVPVWSMVARPDPKKPPIRLLVNGQTERVHGHAPIAWLKVIAVGLGVVALVALVVLVVTWRMT